MSKHRTIRVWASCLACLAIVVAANGAFAQEEQDQPSQSKQSDQYRSSDQDESQYDSQRDQQARQRDQQTRQRDPQARQQDEQARQREQQARQRDQQSRQREQQARQRGQRDWSDMPQPGRSQIGRDSQEYRTGQQSGREQQYSRDQQRGGEEAGLGVAIASDGREGLSVIQVHPGSPAEEMGVRRGDRITHVNGEEVRSAQQFVSTIRNMDPGEEIELDVLRRGEEETFRGELESREEALVLYSQPRSGRWGQSGQPGRDTWQTGYEESRITQGRTGRGNVDAQLSQIERQVNQLSREIEDLRFAIRDIRRQSGEFGRETTARYDEYQYRRPGEGRMTERWRDEQRGRQFDSFRDGQTERQFDSGERGRQIEREREREIEGQQREVRRPIQSEADADIETEAETEVETDTQRRTGDADADEQRSVGGQIGEERQRPGTLERE